MVVILSNGKHVTYGPCYRPASIDQLRAEMLRASSAPAGVRVGAGLLAGVGPLGKA